MKNQAMNQSPSPLLSILQVPWICCCSVTKSCLALCDPMDCSIPGFPVLHHLPEFAQTYVHRVGEAISSTVTPFYFCLQSFPESESFPMSQLFPSGGQSIGASASASVLPINIQGWFPLGLTGLILFPRDTQESSPTPQIESINSSVLSLLYGATLTSIHDYWKKHSFD